MTPSAEILAKLETIKLSCGSHKSAEAGMCAMEAVAWLAGEPHSDTPSCASRVIGAFVIKLNDRWGDTDRQALKAYLPRILGTKGTPAQEIERAWMAADWVLRVCAPTWLELAGLPDEAQLLRGLAALTKDNAAAHRKVASKASDKAYAKRNENRNKLYAAAAAAYAAAAAAYAAAAYDAGKKLSYSEIKEHVTAALDPTIKRVRASALELLDQMIAVTEGKQ